MDPQTEADTLQDIGFEKLSSHEVGPILPKGEREVSEKLNLISKEDWAKNLQNLSEAAAATIKGDSGYFDQQQSLFICALTAEGKITGIPNPIAKPFVVTLENGNPPIPGSRSYLEGEKLAEGSSWYGLIAATVPDTPSRQRMAELFSSTLLKLVIKENRSELASKISEVYWNENTPAAYPIINTQERNNVFEGVVSNPEEAQKLLNIQNPQEMQNKMGNLLKVFVERNATNENLSRWANNWQEKSNMLIDKTADGKKLTLEEVKFIELLSHLYNSEKIVSLLAQNVVSSNPENSETQEKVSTWETIKSRLLKLDSRDANGLLIDLTVEAQKHKQELEKNLLNPSYKDSEKVLAIIKESYDNDTFNQDYLKIANSLRQSVNDGPPALEWGSPAPLPIGWKGEHGINLFPRGQLASFATIENALPGVNIQLIKIENNRSDRLVIDEFVTVLHITVSGSIYKQILADPDFEKIRTHFADWRRTKNTQNSS